MAFWLWFKAFESAPRLPRTPLKCGVLDQTGHLFSIKIKKVQMDVSFVS